MSAYPLDLVCKVNRSHLRADRKAVVFLSAEVEAKELPEAITPGALSVCLAIDCSGSMAGEKLQTAKDAAIQIVGSLRPTDYISVVRFAGQADVVVPRQRVENKNEIQQRLRRMRSGTLTAMYDGIKKAHKELLGGGIEGATALVSGSGIVEGFKKLFGRKPAPGPKTASPAATNELGVSRIILLTDGLPTKGPTDESSFVNLSKGVRDGGISVTTLGIGEDYNEDLLTAIAVASGGKWYHITDVRRLPDIFAEELTEMKTVMLIKPELHAHLMSGAELSNIHRVGTMVIEMTERDFRRVGNDYTIPLEDVRVGQTYRVVFSVHVPPKPLGTWRIAKITLVAPQVELTRDVVVESTQDRSLWSIEGDPYPRTLLMMTQATVLARKGVGDPTVAKQAQGLMETVMKDPNAVTVVKQDRFLTAMGDTVMRVTEQTMMKEKLTEEDKKRLKGEATVVRQ